MEHLATVQAVVAGAVRDVISGTPSIPGAVLFFCAPLLLLLFTLSFMRDPKPAGEGSAPPVWTGGWPLIGHFASFAANPVGTIKAGYLACGPVFTMKFLGFPMTFLIGPDAQAPFFRANDDELSQNEPYKFMTPIFGKGVVFDAPLSVKNQQLRFVSSSLKAAALKTYVPMIVKETEAYLDTWGESGEVDLLHAMARLTILTASRCLLGPEVRENMFEEVASLLHTLDEGISPMAIFFPNLPFYPPFRRRDAARAEIHRLFSKVILARRTAGVKREDMLQAFMDAEYKDGTTCSDYQITGLLLGTLFAGQHTSSISSTWTVLNLLHSPKHLATAMAEQLAVAGPTPGDNSKLDFESVGRMDFLHLAMKESLRMAPPLIMMMRAVHVPLNVGKHVVPVGHYVFTSPAVSMNLPNSASDCAFPDAEVFSPERHLKAPAKPFSYIAFGGGAHGCLGEQFGFMQVKTIVSILLRRFELEVVGDLPKPNYAAMVVGPEEKGRKIRFKKRSSPLV